jgi:hypothetical protein
MALCEMKWSTAPFIIDKRYAAMLRERAETFRRDPLGRRHC